ncbi:GNAT family N-acetyltransferase [Tamlana crocina]|uniref:N-acetyltransferase n=1 Tax=Tamlana crocina TaxID=393006 RepID=A0ABX1DI18_9FLAO|nr:GNAT family N-acetyltransferase [Tamlana crocina]NJX16318.1 N-acetyltransferase [Tamlana crocina]
MQVQHRHHKNKGQFYIEIDGETKAEMTYSMAGEEKMIIDHTEVDAGLKGQGIGYKLVETAVQYARGKQIKILPLCPFANAVFKKKSEYHDVLYK